MKLAALSTAIAALGLGQPQDPPKRVEFEAASIRPAEKDNHQNVHRERGRFTTHNLTLKRLTSIAYGVEQSEVIGGPNWIDSDSYDINAKLPEGIADKTEIPAMVQSLLAERFHLVVRREMREVSGYDLVLAKKGSKMKPAEASGDIQSRTNNNKITAQHCSVADLARQLAQILQKPVSDKSGLAGAFDFELEWAPERLDSKPDDRPSIFTAVQEQLGLKLEPAKISLPAVIIEHAEKPEAN